MDLSQIPGRGLYTEEAREDRLEFLKNLKGIDLDILETSQLSAESMRGNIENHIGFLSIPIGIAGPLVFRRNDRTEEVFAPIATTEGALVASMTRGARAVSLSGGVSARVVSQRMTRTPYFEFESLVEAIDFADWVMTEFPSLQRYIKNFSRFSDLIEIKPRIFGKGVHLIFSFTTRDAAGQNMTTICTWKATQHLLAKTKSQTPFRVKRFILEGGMSADKKAAPISIIEGRGTDVVAEAIVQKKFVEEVLKVRVSDLLHFYSLSKSSRFFSGMLGWNINVANTVAGIFTATGQDIACVHESSLGELHIEPHGDDLYVSMHLPCLIVGTVGGGTRLPSQRACLDILSCEGAGQAQRLAEIIAGFSLALDLSTMSAMIGGQFAEAHSRLSRVSQSLRRQDLDGHFFTGGDFKILKEGEDIVAVHPLESLKIQDSLVMDMGTQVTQKLCGFFPFQIEILNSVTEQRREEKIILKSKPTDEEVILASEMMAAMSGDHLVELYRACRPWNIFQGSHIKELEVARNSELQQFQPRVRGVVQSSKMQLSILASELVEDFVVAPGATKAWTRKNRALALVQLSKIHNVFLGRVAQLPEVFANPLFSGRNLGPLFAFWHEIAKMAAHEFPDVISDQDVVVQQEWMKTLSLDLMRVAQGPLTLIHHDFNSRNIGIRSGDRVCVFDWELAVVHAPYRDLVEFLSFTLSPDFVRADIDEALIAYGERTPDFASMLTCLREFILNRLMMYFVAHSHRECSFLPRVYAVARKLETFFAEEL